MAETTADLSVIESFKQRAQNFWSQWNALQNKSAVITRQSPQIKQEYNDLLSRGSIIRNTVETVTGIIDKATSAYRSSTDWISNLFGVDETPNLGVLPLVIPAAVIATSLAAMGKWLKDVYIFNQKMEKIEQLEAKGVDPITASRIVERIDNSGFNIKGLALPLLLIGGFVAYNMFRKKRK